MKAKSRRFAPTRIPDRRRKPPHEPRKGSAIAQVHASERLRARHPGNPCDRSHGSGKAGRETGSKSVVREGWTPLRAARGSASPRNPVDSAEFTASAYRGSRRSASASRLGRSPGCDRGFLGGWLGSRAEGPKPPALAHAPNVEPGALPLRGFAPSHPSFSREYGYT
jgi:hypothetical protein